MTYAQAIAYFGTQAKLAAALGIRQPSVSAWKRRVITNGELKADEQLRQPAAAGNGDAHRRVGTRNHAAGRR